MITLTRTLPASKTKSLRWFHLVAPAILPSGDACLCRVTICQKTTARSHKTGEDTYLVEEVIDETLPRSWKSFIFTNQTAAPTADRPGQYQVNVDQWGRVVFCGCMGSTCQRQADDACKHRAVITDLLTNPLPDPADADAEYEGRLY